MTKRDASSEPICWATARSTPAKSTYPISAETDSELNDDTIIEGTRAFKRSAVVPLTSNFDLREAPIPVMTASSSTFWTADDLKTVVAIDPTPPIEKGVACKTMVDVVTLFAFLWWCEYALVLVSILLVLVCWMVLMDLTIVGLGILAPPNGWWKAVDADERRMIASDT